MKQANPERKPSLEPWVEVVGDITMSILAYRAERIGHSRAERTCRAVEPARLQGLYGAGCCGRLSVAGGTEGVTGGETGGSDGVGVGVVVTGGSGQVGDGESDGAGVTSGVRCADGVGVTAGGVTGQLGVPGNGLIVGVGVTAAVGR
jgi:hypothetical protein